MTSAAGDDAVDGIKVDQRGNVYVSGPGGLWIISADGRHLGTLVGPEHPHNMACGDDDGRTLYLTAQTGSTGSVSRWPAPACAPDDIGSRRMSSMTTSRARAAGTG